MCTLSWFATPRGYELFFNRDELRSRAPESPPRRSTHGDVDVLAPRDGSAGGSWIAVNEFGVTCALLNGYIQSRGRSDVARRSRGLLVLDLAPARSVDELEAQLRAMDLAPYEPFVLCAFEPAALDPNQPLGRAFDWDGLECRARDLVHGQAPECSSGFDAQGARARRTALWHELREAGPLSRAKLAAFHRSHQGGADAYSPCMHRKDAETRSMVHIEVDPAGVHLSYTPGAPCRTGALPPWSLPRRAPSTSLP